MDSEKSLLLLPFGLFTTQIPYAILGVMYLLYMGMAFLNRSGQSEANEYESQKDVAGKIEFVERSPGPELPVIHISHQTLSNYQSISNPSRINLISDSETTIAEFTCCQNGKRISRCEMLIWKSQPRKISFDLFSRPPPVTA